MTTFPKDPELSELVRRLNTREPEAAALADDPGPIRQYRSDLIQPDAVHSGPQPVARGKIAPPTPALQQLLEEVVRRQASDLLLVTGAPPVVRINGRLHSLSFPRLDDDSVRQLMGPQLRQLGPDKSVLDFALRSVVATENGTAEAYRFRVNIHHQMGELAVSLRLLYNRIPTLSELNLPPQLKDLVRPSRGLVLVCGATGSGKTSTLAALIGEINRESARHVITIEDPVEYLHQHNQALIENIEVGRDATSFADALRAALRQDPDVILVGEMRDLDTAATALAAAETGHLVLATLHTNDAAQAINRIIDLFPPTQHTQIYSQLSLALHAILCQQLVPIAGGAARAPVVELLLATSYAVRAHIRSGKLQNLYNEIVLGKRSGTITFEDSLARLVITGDLSMEHALLRSTHPDELRHIVAGAQSKGR